MKNNTLASVKITLSLAMKSTSGADICIRVLMSLLSWRRGIDFYRDRKQI